MNEEETIAARRMVEAILFASPKPLSEAEIAQRLPDGANVAALIADLGEDYEGRGVNLVKVAGKWTMRTAPDLAFLLRDEVEETRKLSRAAVETLSIIAYHQPITRAEIEELRGVTLSKGTLDVLLEAGWIRPAGRKQTPGRPVLYATSEDFLVHFGLEKISDLPGLEELKAAGILDPIDDALDAMLAQSADQGEDIEDEEDELPLT